MLPARLPTDRTKSSPVWSAPEPVAGTLAKETLVAQCIKETPSSVLFPGELDVLVQDTQEFTPELVISGLGSTPKCKLVFLIMCLYYYDNSFSN
jgi:hypothetical protein